MASSLRDKQKLAQAHLKQLGYYDGAIDGIWGDQSESAFAKYEKKILVPASATIKPPASDFHAVTKTFGVAGDESNLVSFAFPYPMVLAWDKEKTVKANRCHKLIKAPLVVALGL
jgi:peptidoglycan hydrolase-like protein with peptidoglycan-binding domain